MHQLFSTTTSDVQFRATDKRVVCTIEKDGEEKKVLVGDIIQEKNGVTRIFGRYEDGAYCNITIEKEKDYVKYFKGFKQ